MKGERGMNCPECTKGTIRVLVTRNRCPCCNNCPLVCDACFTVFKPPHELDLRKVSTDWYPEEMIDIPSDDFKILARKNGSLALSRVMRTYPTFEEYIKMKNSN